MGEKFWIFLKVKICLSRHFICIEHPFGCHLHHGSSIHPTFQTKFAFLRYKIVHRIHFSAGSTWIVSAFHIIKVCGVCVASSSTHITCNWCTTILILCWVPRKQNLHNRFYVGLLESIRDFLFKSIYSSHK